MAASRSSQRNQLLAFLFATIVVALALYLFDRFFGVRMEQGPHTNVVKIPAVILWALLAYLVIGIGQLASVDRQAAASHAVGEVVS